MSKRSRALYEADLQAQQSPFVAFGTPLPALDPDVRDDGSYVPVWKQEVRDEKGRRRLHGAFTGGWSAGYYNTVGSKEGWTPSTFVSSRTNRRKDQPDAAQHRPEDYMDEEDLADAEEARKIQTSHAFAGLGLTEDDAASRSAAGDRGGLAGLFKVTGETMGTKLLKRMGWKEGQGIGPKVRRTARLDVGGRPGDRGGKTTYLFAPENVVLVRLVKKTDRKGLGYEGEARLASIGGLSRDTNDESEDDDAGISRGLFGRSKLLSSKKKDKKERSSGIGMGILNDTGSDDEDPYDMGPRISFNRVIGGDKKKKKTKSKQAGSAVEAGGGGGTTKSKLTFSSRRPTAFASSTSSTRLCYDGRPPLAGFVFGKEPDALTSEVNAAGKYTPPTIPPGWKSAKQPRGAAAASQHAAAAGDYVSTADAAKASKLDPKSRAAVLGEGQLPGKSVFDFLSPEARERIAAATGRTDLPTARGEIPAEYALTEAEKHDQLLRAVPALDKATAVAAITRGARGGGPYQDNDAKRARYRAYLEHQAGLATALPPAKLAGQKDDDWLRELHEFYNCARIFKPMSGPMASRFTTSSSSSAASQSLASGSSGQADDPTNLVTRPAPKPLDPAEEAAKMGMYGPMTRTVTEFYPTRLLCKRLGVRPPAIVQPDEDVGAGMGMGMGMGRSTGASRSKSSFGVPAFGDYSAAAATPAETAPRAADVGVAGTANLQKPAGTQEQQQQQQQQPQTTADVAVHADRNEALEAQRASEDVFRAVFGDSDDDDD